MQRHHRRDTITRLCGNCSHKQPTEKSRPEVYTMPPLEAEQSISESAFSVLSRVYEIIEGKEVAFELRFGCDFVNDDCFSVATQHRENVATSATMQRRYGHVVTRVATPK